MKNKTPYMKKNILVLSFFLMMLSMPVMAQGFDEDVDDEVPDTPINDYIYVGLVAGALIAIKKLKKSEIL